MRPSGKRTHPRSRSLRSRSTATANCWRASPVRAVGRNTDSPASSRLRMSKSNCSMSALLHFRTALELRQLSPCGPNQAVAAAPKVEADGVLGLATDDHTGRLAVDRAAEVSEIVTDAVEPSLERGATQRVTPPLFLKLPDDLDHDASLLRASLTSLTGPHALHKLQQVLWLPGLLDHCGDSQGSRLLQQLRGFWFRGSHDDGDSSVLRVLSDGAN